MNVYTIKISYNDQGIFKTKCITVLSVSQQKAEMMAKCYFESLGYWNIDVVQTWKLTSDCFVLSSNTPRVFCPNFDELLEKHMV